ncbi:MAG: hypothetical protein ACFCD0_21515 [Gemmataceae bacterium]
MDFLLRFAIPIMNVVLLGLLLVSPRQRQVLFFAITLYVSAFLLFLVQPMISRMILPSLGGTPQVWNTCVVFFQTALLAGYFYTHTITTRLRLRQQLMTHGVLLLLPLVLLFLGGFFLMSTTEASSDTSSWVPFYSQIKAWKPPAGGNPIVATLLLLTLVVGLPFFVVSTSAPLLQRWFAYTGDKQSDDPYFLYGASNLGSMLSLFFYPFIVEPYFGLKDQSWTWAIGYVTLLVGYFICVGLVFRSPTAREADEKAAKEKAAKAKAAKDNADLATKAPTTEKKEEPKETGITEKPAEGATSEARSEETPEATDEETEGKTEAKSTAKTTTDEGAPKKKKKKKKSTETGITSKKSSTAGAIRKGTSKKSLKSGLGKKGTDFGSIRTEDVTVWRRLRWVALAFVPSSLMLGITTYISTDVSAIPLFWVLPLALYLLSFILVFSKWPVSWVGQPHTLMVVIQPLFLGGFLYLLLTHQVSPIWRSISLSIAMFFVTAMVCHGEMARDRPSTKHLTEFYLLMSVGGMLGGVFNGILAPILFTYGLVELPIVLGVACLLRPLPTRLAPVERPLLVIFAAVIGGICGFMLLSSFSIILAPLFGLVMGALLGFIFASDGLTEQILLSLFPGMGEWFDEKGKELREQSNQPQGADTPKKKRRRKTPPDYFLLNYSLDFILPLGVALLMYAALAYQDSVAIWFQGLGKNWLAYKASGAAVFGQRAAYAMMYGLPAVLAFFMSPRPVRFGLAISAIVFVNGVHERSNENKKLLERTRSYFGVLRVLEENGSFLQPKEITTIYKQRVENVADPVKQAELRAQQNMFFQQLELLKQQGKFDGDNYFDLLPAEFKQPSYHYLMHGTTHHGLNYQDPPELRRLATTYYHRFGPVGVIFERFNWFPGPQNTYWADARMPVSLAGIANDPMVSLVNLWTEPPYACIGLGTGTMASYARPYQHMTFYEIDDKIRRFSLPLPKGNALYFDPSTKESYYNYLRDAIDRGAMVEVMMGDARQSMRPDIEAARELQRSGRIYDKDEGELVRKEDVEADLDNSKLFLTKDELSEKDQWRAGQLRDGSTYATQFRENYYHAIEVDAFSSDAIPVHLITKEAILQYLDKMVPGGVLMVHTSNRHVDLPPPVIDIATSLNPRLQYRVVNCRGESDPFRSELRRNRPNVASGARGHFQSEYVMLALPPKTETLKRELTARLSERLKNLGMDKLKTKAQADEPDEPKLLSENPILYRHLQRALGRPSTSGVGLEGKALAAQLTDGRVGYLPEGSTKAQQALFYAVMNPNSSQFKNPPDGTPYQLWDIQKVPGRRVWTDDYANLLSVFRWGFGRW